MPYFGYGYIKNVDDLVPSIPLCFYAFRVMVGLGCLFIVFFAVVLYLLYKKDIAKMRWLLMFAIALVPLAYIASESGWIVAEMGRQPWTIQDMLPVGACRKRCTRHQCSHNILHIPGTLHHDARRRNQHHAQANKKRSGRAR